MIRLLFLFLFLPLSLSAEIYEVLLSVDGLTCSYCGKVVEKDLSEIKGTKSVKAWPCAGIATIQWGEATPFHMAYVNKAFAKSCFRIQQVDIDLEGTIEIKKNAVICTSMPDGSVFYLENRTSHHVKHLQDGQVVRLKGTVSSEQGFNFLCVKEVLAEVK